MTIMFLIFILVMAEVLSHPWPPTEGDRDD